MQGRERRARQSNLLPFKEFSERKIGHKLVLTFFGSIKSTPLTDRINTTEMRNPNNIMTSESKVRSHL